MKEKKINNFDRIKPKKKYKRNKEKFIKQKENSEILERYNVRL